MASKDLGSTWSNWCLLACLFAVVATSSLAMEPSGGGRDNTAETPAQPPGIATASDLPPSPTDVSSPRGSSTPLADLPPGESAYPDTGLPPLGLASAGEPAHEASPIAADGWPDAESLLTRLDELAAERATAEWADQAGRLVRRLGPAALQGSDEVGPLLGQLQEMPAGADALAARLDDRDLARKLIRAGYALKRRVDVWQYLVEIGCHGPITAGPVQGDPAQLSLYLAEIDQLTGDSPRGRSWREYLLVDKLREWSDGDARRQDRLPQALAQRVLDRLNHRQMSASQRQFLSSRAIAGLRQELQRWAAEPVDPQGLLDHMERYEQTGLASDARRLAADCRHLALDASGDRRRLAQRLEANYRNANLRLTVTEELLDRLMPEQEPLAAQVRDTVLGRPVTGRSVTSADLGVDMLPDPDRLRLALEITGQVVSLTSSTAGPATFFSDSTSNYTARKPVEIDLGGIRLSPAEVEVQSDSRIRDLQTDFDGVPVLGGLVHRVARSQHDLKHDEAIREVKHKVAGQARQQIDSEVEARLGEVSDKLQQQVLDPLEAAGLDPTIVDAYTTDERLTIRLRLAGEDQLGSHTPRPQAPADSLASFQIHESAINNMLESLELDGRTFTLQELSEHVATRLGRPLHWEIEPENEDVSITFAKQDALGVRLQDGRVLLRLGIAKLKKSSRSWKDFEVHVYYQPQAEGRSAVLVRDGTIQLAGRRFATGSQIVLRGIFTKVFYERQLLDLMPELLAADPRLDDLAVTQFVVEDGWIGVALGPQRILTRSAMLPH